MQVHKEIKDDDCIVDDVIGNASGENNKVLSTLVDRVDDTEGDVGAARRLTTR